MDSAWQCLCGKWLDVPAEQRDETAQCPWCGNQFVAGAPIRSSTAVQTEEPPARVVVASRESVGNASAVAINIDINARPWLIHPVIWSIALGGILSVGLALLSYCFLFSSLGTTQTDLAQTQTKALSQVCDAYHKKFERFPKSLQILLERDKLGQIWIDHEDKLVDPWGHPYQYDPKGPRNDGKHADIWCVAPDGHLIGNWPRIKR